MNDTTDLITSRDLLPTVFESKSNVEAMIVLVERDARAETHDVMAEDGRKGIASLARKVSRSKTAIQGIGDPLAKEYRERWDGLNVLRRLADDRLDALRDEIKEPLTKWREAAAARIKGLEDRLAGIEELALDRSAGTEALGDAIATAEAIKIDDTWQEFQDDAGVKRDAVLVGLRRELEAAEVLEAAADELETLRAEKLKREFADRKAEAKAEVQRMIDVAAERGRAAEKTKAAAALEAERDKAEREHREAEARVATAERERDEAAGLARKRIEEFEAEKNAAREKRERDDENRAHVFSMATDALVAAPVKLKRADAVRVIAAISDKLIPNLSINF